MDFVAWHQPANLDPNSEAVNKRKKGTDQLAKSIAPIQILDLVRLSFGTGDLENDLNELMAVYKKLEESFAPDSDRIAVEVLAGCVLATLMSVRGKRGLIASLASVSRKNHLMEKVRVANAVTEMPWLSAPGNW